MKVRIKAQLQSMAQPEIMSMVNQDTLSRIKSTDPNPEIRVYVVGHEGVSEPQMIGSGRRVFQYFKEAIYKLAGHLREGVQAFHNHVDGTNSHAGRQSIGEVIGKATKEINGKLSALAAVYIKPEARNKSLDIASIEADVEYVMDDKGHAQVDRFIDISGIALGNSKENRPAFAGATLLATMQAFERKSRGSFSYSKGGDMELEEIIAAIKEKGFTPGQVFNESQLKGDSSIKVLIQKAEQTGYEHHRQKLERQLGKPVDDFIKESDEKIKNLTKQNEELSVKAISSKTGSLIETLSKERKLNPKQIAFIKKNEKSLAPAAKTDEELKLEVNKFIDGQLSDFAENVKILGGDVAKETAPVEGDAGGDKGAGGKATPAGKEGEGSVANSEEAMDPAKNDFIPKVD